MKFTKPALTFVQQVAHLFAKGMEGDGARIQRCLAEVNDCRLSACWHTSLDPSGQRLEVAVRTQLAHEHARAGGSFGCVEGPSAVWGVDPARQGDCFARLDQALHTNRKEPFIEHFSSKYGDTHRYPHVWVGVDVLMFGDLVSCYRGSPKSIRRAVGVHFGVAREVMDSWLLSLNVVRTLCALHSRLWNRQLGVQPLIPRHDPAWRHPVEVKRDRLFGALTVLADVMRRVAVGSWSHRLRELVERDPSCIPAAQMGFPHNGTSCAVWRRAMVPEPLG